MGSEVNTDMYTAVSNQPPAECMHLWSRARLIYFGMLRWLTNALEKLTKDMLYLCDMFGTFQ